MTKIAGSGSISHKHGSEDPDPDPPQNVMDPEHCIEACQYFICVPFFYILLPCKIWTISFPFFSHYLFIQVSKVYHAIE
jgi:hypothetical protein